MYVKIKNDVDYLRPWLKWRVMLYSSTGAVVMRGTRLYPHIQDARKFARYVASGLKIKAVLKV